MGQFNKTIDAVANMSIGYTEALLKDVTQADFARFAAPGGTPVASNHPAFVIGHLSIYPARIMDFLGRPRGVTERPAGYEDLFKAGAICQDDPAGTIYPGMETLTAYYFNAHKAVLAAIAEAPEELFTKPNPAGGRMTERLPTIGDAVIFLLGSHQMSHLGQFSAWRRMKGLPSAF